MFLLQIKCAYSRLDRLKILHIIIVTYLILLLLYIYDGLQTLYLIATESLDSAMLYIFNVFKGYKLDYINGPNVH